MKKVLLSLSLLLSLSINAFASAPDLSIGSISAFAGQLITVPVTADFSVPVGSVQLTVKYDPALLTVTSVALGSANPGWFILNNPQTPGTLLVGMFSTAGIPLSGNGQVIANINFTVNANPGAATLTSPNLNLSAVMFDETNINTLINGNFTLGLLGDVNGDGKVTIADAQLITQEVVGLTTFTPAQIQSGELDGTSSVDIYDAYLIAEYVAGITSKP